MQNAGVLGAAPLIPSFIPQSVSAQSEPTVNPRKLWLDYLKKLTEPVLTALAADQLKERMPVETRDPKQGKDRVKYTHLEAFGRLLCGIAPWLQTKHTDPTEQALQEKYFTLALKATENAVNENARDYMNWGEEGGQPLVDASFFAYALLRCPNLWYALSVETQRKVINCLKKTRTIKPPENNWLLFAAMIEAFFIFAGEPFDKTKIEYAINRHLEWYKGDGMFGDGHDFHWDYYNSFVIHPYLYDILKIVAANDPSYQSTRNQIIEYNLRYAAVLERMIGPDSSYPLIGRSITYRTGAFHHLANMALQSHLPEHLKPAQVRCALTAVIGKFMTSKDILDQNGWLRIGLYGHQPSLAEGYISTGSLYLSSAILLPLGLPASDLFWSSPDEDWTAKKLAKGIDLPADHSL